MNVYLVGQKQFAVDVLTLLQRLEHQVVGVCAPLADRLFAAAESAGIVATTRLSPPEGIDLIIAAHAHVFITGPVRARARMGTIGYHPSLLPLHRGRDAIRWALHMGERVTGGTVYRLDDGVDTGNILAQEHVFVRPGELAPLGVRLFERVLGAGTSLAEGIEQDHSLASWEPSWERAPLARS
jgi:methionyl-tRNA formyltransferase